MKQIKLPAPAKLNLCLHINGQRDDGYHELQTLFQFVDICDELNFEVTDSPDIVVTPDIPGVSTEDNLIYKAASLMQRHQHKEQTVPPNGVRIHLEKNLPMGGGLGGGSSDAATTLVALNILWKIDLSMDQLATIGLSLGADVPIFIHGHAAWAEGVGEQLTQAHPQTPYYLIVSPACEVNTGEIFSHKRLTRDSPKMKIAPALEGVITNLYDNDSQFKNDCQKVVCENYPEVKTAMDWLNNFSTSRLTGTGACVFAPFERIQDAMDIASKAPSNVKTFVTQALNVSPLIHSLRELEKSSL